MAKKAEARKASVARTPDIDVVTDPVTLEEVKLVTEVGAALAKFVAGAAAFFTSAKQIELEAQRYLEDMRAMKAPTTSLEDEAVQLRIKSGNGGKKKAEEHWHLICSTVFQFHRRLTGRRDRAVKWFEEGASIGNRHHNKWTADAQRVADIENERRRREAEAEAETKRQRELDDLEQQRMKLEAASGDLSDREQVYVQSRLDGFTPFNAATRAGYRKPTEVASRLEDTAKITAAITAGQKARALAQQITATKALPLEVQVDTVQADVVRAPGASDRSRWSAEILDEAAFRDAVFEGKYGIPRDVLVVDPAAVNRYAKDMHELINKWPGVRAKKTTGVV